MRSYELTLILSTVLEKDDLDKALTKIKKMVDDLKGNLGQANEWGKRDFAYPVKKQKAGVYFHFELEIDGQGAQNLENKLRLEETVLRHLLVRKE